MTELGLAVPKQREKRPGLVLMAFNLGICHLVLTGILRSGVSFGVYVSLVELMLVLSFL